jgi:hypothetical protein
MSAPLLDVDSMGLAGRAASALAIGAGFGWALERAGLGSARKLMGQFTLTDLTVLKVMLSAIVTAMLGAFWLGYAGLLDVSRVVVPETWLAPQVAGGLVFGAGFVIAGLCPGTSCVAAATGRGDGAFAMLGMLAGALVTGVALEPLRAFYESTARGALTWPEVLHVSYGAAVLGLVIVAFAAFALAERIERRAWRT